MAPAVLPGSGPGARAAKMPFMHSPELRREVERLPWFHTIDLGNGVVTPGRDDSAMRLGRLGLPADLSGRSVLDIGAYDGFFSFEAERRGASRVVAADTFVWRELGRKRSFELARGALRSRVEDVEVEVLELSPERVGHFDIVLFLGVLYHLRDPLMALERVASVTDGLLVLETHVDLTLTRRPAMAFYPRSELNDDPSNWWGPNPAAVEEMLRVVGFSKVEAVSPSSLPYDLARAARRSLGRRGGAQQGRLVVHASR